MTRKKEFKKKYQNNNSNEIKPFSSIKQTKKVTNSTKSVSGIKGLLNLGNTCYFNSMLQMLLQSPAFLHNLNLYCSADQSITARIDDKDYELILKTTDVSSVEKELLTIRESESDSISPSNLRNALLQHKDFKTHFSGFNEHDSHEVFLMVLNIIKEVQIKRIRGAILDYFNCRKNPQTQICDETKKKIKEMSTVLEKQTLVHNHFGIIVGSNLKCQKCGEMRMRFDEVFHISPVFLSKCEVDAVEETVEKKTDGDIIIVKQKNQTVQNEKFSKNQLKRQKRMEKKTARNKKSIQRNIHCSSDEIPLLDQNENSIDDLNIDSEIIKDNEHKNLPIIIGGQEDENIDDEIVVQQIIYDAVMLESHNYKRTQSHCSSSNGSMIVRKNDSTPLSLASLNSSVNFDEECHEDELCNEFTKNLSVEDINVEAEVETVESDSDIDNYPPIKKVITNNSDILTFIDEPLNIDETVINENIVVVDSQLNNNNNHNNKKFLQNVFSSVLDIHQENLHNLKQPKIRFESETDLDQALTRLNTPIFLENIVCETCSKANEKLQTDHIKTDVICHLPQILPFYISRFKQFAARNKTKNTQLYTYPFILNLSSQCSKFVNFSSSHEPVLYRLFGIIEHIGVRINTGHYVSYVSRRIETSDTLKTNTFSTSYPINMLSELCRKYKEEEDKYQNNLEGLEEQIEEGGDSDIIDQPSDYQWFRVSDNHVESVSNKCVMNVQAFMLFYTRIK